MPQFANIVDPGQSWVNPETGRPEQWFFELVRQLWIRTGSEQGATLEADSVTSEGTDLVLNGNTTVDKSGNLDLSGNIITTAGFIKVDEGGGSSAEAEMDVSGDIALISLVSSFGGAFGGPLIDTYHGPSLDGGSAGNGDTIFKLECDGDNSSDNPVEMGLLYGISETVTASSEDFYWNFNTRRAGSQGDRLRIGGGLYHPSATGGDKGNNTINFGAVYDDNTLLTDYVLDFAVDGYVLPDDYNHVKWYDFDPSLFCPDIYAKYWKDNRHLPPFLGKDEETTENRLSTGEYIQGLMETVETQAVLIENLNQRVKTLENDRTK